MTAPTRIQVRDIGGGKPHGWVPTSTPPGEYVDAPSYDFLDLDRDCRLEIEGEWLEQIEAKGYAVARHGPNGGGPACFTCTLTRLLDSLPPKTSPAPAGTGVAAFTAAPAGERGVS